MTAAASETASYKREIHRIMLEIVKGVVFIHGCGWTHHDLNWKNIFLTGETDTVKIADFGLATQADVLISGGTPYCKSPEKYYLFKRKILEQRQCDSRSADIWALGLLFYQLLLPKSVLDTT